MEKFTVTLNHHAHYGYVEYDPETKTASVVLDVPEAKARVEEFLSKPLTLDLPEGETIRQFVTKTLMPLDSLENLLPWQIVVQYRCKGRVEHASRSNG